jgi:hypothetical protein
MGLSESDAIMEGVLDDSLELYGEKLAASSLSDDEEPGRESRGELETDSGRLDACKNPPLDSLSSVSYPLKMLRLKDTSCGSVDHADLACGSDGTRYALGATAE